MQTDKLIYIDGFQPNNSNYYWLDSFKKVFKEVHIINIFNKEERNHSFIMNKVNLIKPDMVHMGGSSKHDGQVPLPTLSLIKKKVNRVTSFYGDVFYNPYLEKRSQIIDLTILTNASLLFNNKIKYYPCPIKLEWDRPENPTPKYDLAFIGNNYSETRRKFLLELAKDFSVTVFGKGWEGLQKLNPQGSCKVEDAPQNYRQAKIAVDDPVTNYCKYTGVNIQCSRANVKYFKKSICQNEDCPDFEPTWKWFSNRVIIMMLSRRPILAAKRNGQERVIQNVEYYDGFKDVKTAKEKIKYILNNPLYGSELANKARKEVEKYNFDRLVSFLVGRMKTFY